MSVRFGFDEGGEDEHEVDDEVDEGEHEVEVEDKVEQNEVGKYEVQIAVGELG